MRSSTRRLVTLVAALVALAALASLIEHAIDLAERIAGLPPWLRWSVAGLVALLVVGGLWFGWTWFRPRRTRRPAPIDRSAIDARLDALDGADAATEPLHAELAELDRRRAEARLYVAVFGEISSGKSSLIAALTSGPAPASDVIGGTTTAVECRVGKLTDGREVVFADVPGSAEVGGEDRERLARDEALRAHVVVYVTAADLNRAQAAEVAWLAEFGKPVIVVLNKADRYSAAELDALTRRLAKHGAGRIDQVVAVSAGGLERFERRLADGRVERVERSRQPDIDALRRAIKRSAAIDLASLEQARERAVLAGIDQRAGELEAQLRATQSAEVVARYTRRAAVGALAAVVPGSDLVIQGVLATALTRELARIHDVRVSDLEIEAFLKQARLTLRTSASVVLAIAGNALKAFPGLGTLGGGVLHAFAYALIFDSLGKALARSFAEHRALDHEAAGAALRELLGDASGERLANLARITRAALAHRGDGND